MYAVIDSKTIPCVPLRENAELTMKSLRQFNKEADWQLFVKVQTHEGAEALERLYALASLLLNAAGVNPFELSLERPELDGSITSVSSVQVMQEARNWIDQVRT